MRDKPRFKSNRHVLYSCRYHVVFCSKYRRIVLIGGVDKRLKEIIHQVAKELGCDVLELEVMPDPIHKFVKRVKGRSSRLLRHDEKELARIQRNLSKAEKGTPERARRGKAVQHVHQRIANRRKDFAHQLIRELAEGFGRIAFENLHIKNMLQNHRLAKSIPDAGWSQLIM